MQTESHIPRSVIAFLRDHVDHAVKLRLLVLLHAAPDATSRVPSLASILDASRAQVRDMANELAADGLVRVSGDEVQLAPASIDQRLAIAEVARSYASNRPALLSLLEVISSDQRR
jgi:DNA-binding GntR family transcriptional regulator